MEIFEIQPNLFQSTKIDDAWGVTGRDIKTVIDLEGGFDKIFTAVLDSYLYWHIFDMPWLPDLENLWNVARYGFNAWKADQKVLVHCSMGRNRSGLVNGCILWLDGMSGVEAVKLIQEKRPGALVNPVFKHYLENLSERR
jgi:protein-tyrosine phosphatase